MIVVLATNDENDHPFWLAKVTKVFKEHDVLNGVEVHWYNTTAKDPLKGKYDPEMVKSSKKGKRLGSSCCVDTLNLVDVEILVYGFDLKKSGHLRKITILLDVAKGLFFPCNYCNVFCAQIINEEQGFGVAL